MPVANSMWLERVRRKKKTMPAARAGCRMARGITWRRTQVDERYMGNHLLRPARCLRRKRLRPPRRNPGRVRLRVQEPAAEPAGTYAPTIPPPTGGVKRGAGWIRARVSRLEEHTSE